MSTQPLMKHEVVLPVIVDGYHWACNQDRMWNLNELHKELELPSAKEPGQWRSSVRTLLDQDANLHVAHGLPLRGGLSRSVGCDFRVQTKGVHVNVST